LDNCTAFVHTAIASHAVCLYAKRVEKPEKPKSYWVERGPVEFKRIGWM